MTNSGLSAVDPILRSPRFGIRLRFAIVIETVATYLRVRWLMLGREITEVVAILRGSASDERDPAEARLMGKRLGHPVRRTLDPLPWDSRCLMRSLVLMRMLARRGIVCSLVIGVRPGTTFEAHAWIEHAGRPLLPTLGFERLTVI